MCTQSYSNDGIDIVSVTAYTVAEGIINFRFLYCLCMTYIQRQRDCDTEIQRDTDTERQRSRQGDRKRACHITQRSSLCFLML